MDNGRMSSPDSEAGAPALTSAAAETTRGSAIKLGTAIVARLVGLATTLLLARRLGAADFGLFGFLSVIGVVIAEAADLGLQGTASRALVAGTISLTGLTRAKLVITVCVAGLAGLALPFAPVLVPLILFFVLAGWSEFLGVALRARGDRGLESAVIFCLRLVGLLLVGGALYSGMGLVGVGWATRLAAGPRHPAGVGVAREQGRGRGGPVRPAGPRDPARVGPARGERGTRAREPARRVPRPVPPPRGPRGRALPGGPARRGVPEPRAERGRRRGDAGADARGSPRRRPGAPADGGDTRLSRRPGGARARPRRAEPARSRLRQRVRGSHSVAAHSRARPRTALPQRPRGGGPHRGGPGGPAAPPHGLPRCRGHDPRVRAGTGDGRTGSGRRLPRLGDAAPLPGHPRLPRCEVPDRGARGGAARARGLAAHGSRRLLRSGLLRGRGGGPRRLRGDARPPRAASSEL